MRPKVLLLDEPTNNLAQKNIEKLTALLRSLRLPMLVASHDQGFVQALADEMDIQVAIHTDTLNESGFLEDTMQAINGRVIHTFHTEGAGGGHAPDIIKAAMHLPIRHVRLP